MHWAGDQDGCDIQRVDRSRIAQDVRTHHSKRRNNPIICSVIYGTRFDPIHTSCMSSSGEGPGEGSNDELVRVSDDDVVRGSDDAVVRGFNDGALCGSCDTDCLAVAAVAIRAPPSLRASWRLGALPPVLFLAFALVLAMTDRRR